MVTMTPFDVARERGNVVTPYGGATTGDEESMNERDGAEKERTDGNR